MGLKISKYEKGLISAIITTYKRPVSVLNRAIRSVLNQTYSDIELIVINDSPDYEKRVEIDKLIQNYKITYHINEQTKGANYSRNYGITLSHGEFLAFLDDDDEWLSNKIEVMIEGFTNNKVGLVYCDIILNSNGKDSILQMAEYPDNEVIKNLLDHNYIGGFSGPIIRREVLNRSGMLDENLLSSQDSDLWRRLALKSNLYHVNQPLIRYYISKKSISSDFNNRLKGTLALIQKFDYLYEKYPEVRKRHISRSVLNFMRAGWFKGAFLLYTSVYSSPRDILLNIYTIPLGLVKRIIKIITHNYD